MTPAGARSRAPTGVIVFPKGFQRAQPLCRRRHSSSLLLNVYATVACRRRLQKAPRRIHERLPRTHSRPAQGLDKDPKLVWDMLEAGNAKARARASRNLDALKKKLNFIFLEKAGKMPSAAGGSAPGPLDLENNDACWRAKPRANRRHCFPQGVSKGAQPLCRRRHSSSLLLNVYATVACRRRLQKLLVESMNAFLEPIRDRRKALTKTPSSSGTCSKPATPKPAPGPRGIWMRSRKS